MPLCQVTQESVSGASRQSLQSKPWRAPHNIQTDEHVALPCCILQFRLFRVAVVVAVQIQKP
jgi:hypothetical protein